jgi:hypothetical protein
LGSSLILVAVAMARWKSSRKNADVVVPERFKSACGGPDFLDPAVEAFVDGSGQAVDGMVNEARSLRCKRSPLPCCVPVGSTPRKACPRQNGRPLSRVPPLLLRETLRSASGGCQTGRRVLFPRKKPAFPIAQDIDLADTPVKKPRYLQLTHSNYNMKKTNRSCNYHSLLKKDIVSLNNLQKRLVISVSASSAEKCQSVIEGFLPVTNEYWEHLEQAKCPRDKYITSLLNLEKVPRRIEGLNRGARLVYSAASWRNPKVGPRETSAAARGLQWKTTMAWSGCELMIQSILPRYSDFNGDPVAELCHILDLDLLASPIRVPSVLQRSTAIRDLWKDEQNLFEFLGVRGGKPRSILTDWWINGNPLTKYCTALHAVRAIRDITAHGLLSANRINKFGLANPNRSGDPPILDELIAVVIKVAVSVLNRCVLGTTPRIQK